MFSTKGKAKCQMYWKLALKCKSFPGFYFPNLSKVWWNQTGFYHIFARHHSATGWTQSNVLSGMSGQMFIPEKVIRRFAWSLAFLASLTLLILQVSHDFDWTYDSFTFQSSNRVRYYLERPHVTKLDEISGGILRFPAVTICNLNEFRFSQITKNDM